MFRAFAVIGEETGGSICRRRQGWKHGSRTEIGGIYFERVMVMTRTTEERLLTAAAVADMLDLSKRQIFRLNSSGKIPGPVRIGGSVRWRQSEIEAWLAADAPDRETWNSMKGKNNDG